MPKTTAEYLSLPYTLTLKWDQRDQIFVAGVQEIPGCSAHGATEPEAISNLRENMQAWIEDCIESGDPVPVPVAEVEMPSGKWVQRVPRSLHLKLIQAAKEEGVSLNQFVTSALGEAIGKVNTKELLDELRHVRLLFHEARGPKSLIETLSQGARNTHNTYWCGIHSHAKLQVEMTDLDVMEPREPADEIIFEQALQHVLMDTVGAMTLPSRPWRKERSANAPKEEGFITYQYR